MNDLRAVRAHRSAFTVCLLALVAGIGQYFAWRTLPSRPLHLMELVSFGASFAAAVGLWITRDWPSTRRASIAFLVVALPMVGLGWLNDAGRAVQGVYWVPFEVNKLASIVLALMAPPVAWVGALAIGALMGSALVHYAILPATARAMMAAGEPWDTLIYTALAAGLLLHRLSVYRMEAAALEARTEVNVLQRMGRTFLAIRDLMNTPLQTLELVGHQLQYGTDAEIAAQRVQRTVARLTALSGLLSRYSRDVRFEANLTSFDPLKFLEQDLSSHKPQ